MTAAKMVLRRLHEFADEEPEPDANGYYSYWFNTVEVDLSQDAVRQFNVQRFAQNRPTPGLCGVLHKSSYGNVRFEAADFDGHRRLTLSRVTLRTDQQMLYYNQARGVLVDIIRDVVEDDGDEFFYTEPIKAD